MLKSWTVPKGPSLDPSIKRLAVEVEDHLVDYIDFEGHIAQGNYGAGDVVVWDIGPYQLVEGDDPMRQWAAGRIKFTLNGKKLKGEFNLVRLNRPKQWLLMKTKDDFAQAGWELKTLIGENDNQPKTSARTARKSTLARPRAMTARTFVKPQRKTRASASRSAKA